MTVLLLAFVPFATAQPWVNLVRVEAAMNVDALQPGAQAVVAVVLDIQHPYHAQSNTPLDETLIPTTVTLEADPRLTAYQAIYPPAIERTYEALGRLSLFEGRVVVFVPIEISRDAAPGEFVIRGNARVQVCDDQACFPPTDYAFEIPTNIVAAGSTVSPANAELFATFDPRVWAGVVPAGKIETSDSTATTAFGTDIRKMPLAGVIGIAFVVGLILNVMPCVLPVLPLKAMGFYEAAKLDRGKCFRLGLVFSLGMIATFAVLAGLVVGLAGVSRINWGEMFSNVYFAAIVSGILLVLAVGTFGVFEVLLPTKVYSFSPKHDTYGGNFFWGVLTAVLSTPCTFGAFAALIAFVLTQPAWVGIALLSTVGAGMASPYLVLSAFPQVAAKLPSAGPGANVVKQTMAFLLVATAIFFAAPLLPKALRGDVKWWLIFATVAAGCVFLVVKVAILMPRPRAIANASIFAVVVAGLALWITLIFTRPTGDWVAYSEAALAEARASGRVVVVKFTAEWCTNCKVVENTVFGSAETRRELQSQNVQLIKADLTDNDAPGWPALTALNPSGSIPFTAVYLPNESNPIKLTGIYTSTELLAAIRK